MFQGSILKGIGYFLQGFSLLAQSGLKRFVVIPIILNILFFSLLIGVGIHLMGMLVNNYLYLLPEWLYWLKWILWFLFFFVSAVVFIYFFMIITNLISAPFNSLLSEKVELILTGEKLSEGNGLRDTIKEVPKALKREWLKIKYYLLRSLFLLILFLIPGINIIAGLLWFIFSCWMMAVEYVDYPFDNRKKEFKKLHKYLKDNCLTSVGFGFAVMIASLIPIINFVVIPAAVIGGTCMWVGEPILKSK